MNQIKNPVKSSLGFLTRGSGEKKIHSEMFLPLKVPMLCEI